MQPLTVTKEDILAAKAEERRLWGIVREAEKAIRAAAGPDLCAAERDASAKWGPHYKMTQALESLFLAQGGEL